MAEQKEAYIIGAGISGLISAYELEQAGYHPTVFEKSSAVGGRVKTLQENGYALDLGFQVLLSAYPMAKKYLDLKALKLDYLESGALIYSHGRSYRIGDPLRNWKMLLPTLLADVGSLADKLKIFKLNRLLKKKSLEDIFHSPEQSTRAYLEEFGFSEKIIQRFFKPFFAGIFLESELATSSRMFEFVYKMFGEGYATIPQAGIGAISEQLKSKLKHTQFHFNTAVDEVSNEHIALLSGDKVAHNGVIIATPPSKLLSNLNNQEIAWKSCQCLYFEVDQTNIPPKTIALVADANKYSNNLYAYTDAKTGKTLLSVTVVKAHNLSDQNLVAAVTEEVKQYTGATAVNIIQHYPIKQALPNIENLKGTVQPSESQMLENVFLAGDHLLNGSLNAAMESGRLAAKALLEKSVLPQEVA